jgi:hypothetical protein
MMFKPDLGEISRTRIKKSTLLVCMLISHCYVTIGGTVLLAQHCLLLFPLFPVSLSYISAYLFAERRKFVLSGSLIYQDFVAIYTFTGKGCQRSVYH